MIAEFGQVISVNLAVKFNCQPLGRTIKVQDIVAYTVLPPKFSPIELRSLQ